LHEICEFLSRKQPNAEAVVHEGRERQSWRALDDQAERIAALLAARGIEKGDRVCFLGRNCIEVFHLLFACSKLGATYVPINYRLALPEITQVLEDSRPRIFIAHDEYTETARKLMSDPAAGSVEAWFVAGAAAPADLSLEAALAAAPARAYFPVIADED